MLLTVRAAGWQTAEVSRRGAASVLAPHARLHVCTGGAGLVATARVVWPLLADSGTTRGRFDGVQYCASMYTLSSCATFVELRC